MKHVPHDFELIDVSRRADFRGVTKRLVASRALRVSNDTNPVAPLIRPVGRSPYAFVDVGLIRL